MDSYKEQVEWRYSERMDEIESSISRAGSLENLWLAQGGHSSQSYQQLQANDQGQVAPQTFHIVRYRSRQIVLYDPYLRRIGAQQLSAAEEQTITARRLARCPMCSQAVDLRTFSFTATSYFLNLHEMYRGRHQRQQRHHHHNRGSENISASDPFYPHTQDVHASTTSVSSAPFSLEQNPFSAPLLSPAAPRGRSPSAVAADAAEQETRNIPREVMVTGYYNRFFVESRKLGSGSYGQVYLCEHILDDLCLGQYAVKKIPVGDNKRWMHSMLREVKMRERFHHPNIVDYKHSWMEMHRQSEFCCYVPWFFVLMEYCNGGNLEDLIWHEGLQNPVSEFLTDMQSWKIFLDICFGLQHLHHMGILHRDL